MSERKPCAGCPWTSDDPYCIEWKEHMVKLLHLTPRPRFNSQQNTPTAPVQGCHNLTDQHVPLDEHKHACAGHLNVRLKEAQQSGDEELIQELTLLYNEVNG